MFPDLQFSRKEGCKKEFIEISFYKNKFTKKNDCMRKFKLNEEFHLEHIQIYENQKLIEYQIRIQGAEPLYTYFNKNGEIKEIGLSIKGSDVFGVHFKNKLSRKYIN